MTDSNYRHKIDSTVARKQGEEDQFCLALGRRRIQSCTDLFSRRQNKEGKWTAQNYRALAIISSTSEATAFLSSPDCPITKDRRTVAAWLVLRMHGHLIDGQVTCLLLYNPYKLFRTRTSTLYASAYVYIQVCSVFTQSRMLTQFTPKQTQIRRLYPL